MQPSKLPFKCWCSKWEFPTYGGYMAFLVQPIGSRLAVQRANDLGNAFKTIADCFPPICPLMSRSELLFYVYAAWSCGRVAYRSVSGEYTSYQALRLPTPCS